MIRAEIFWFCVTFGEWVRLKQNCKGHIQFVAAAGAKGRADVQISTFWFTKMTNNLSVVGTEYFFRSTAKYEEVFGFNSCPKLFEASNFEDCWGICMKHLSLLLFNIKSKGTRHPAEYDCHFTTQWLTDTTGNCSDQWRDNRDWIGKISDKGNKYNVYVFPWHKEILNL